MGPMWERVQAAQQQTAATSDDGGRWSSLGGSGRQDDGMFSEFGRGLGFLVNNPVTQTAIRPLTVLDVPRRHVAFTGEQIGRIVSGNEMLDWDEWKERVSDPTYGMGRVIPDTGIGALDRTTGFLGDVLTDPLSYFTFGAGRLGGAAGRASAAARLGGMRNPDGSARFSEDVIDRIGRLGVNAATPAEREALGIGQAGLRWGGMRIPGTQGFAEDVGTKLAQARAAAMGGRFGDQVRRFRTPSGSRQNPVDLRDAYQRLFTGRGPQTAREAAAQVAYANNHRLGVGDVRARFGHRTNELMRRTPRGQRQMVTREIESGASSQLADAHREVFREMRDIHERAARNAGLEPQIGDLGPNYVPHYWTREGRQWLFESDDPLAAEARRVFRIDDTAGSGRAAQRQITPGTYTIGDQTFTLRTGTIDEINDVLTNLNPRINRFLEDDISEILLRYRADIEQDVGRLTGVGHLLEQYPEVARRARDVMVRDEAATARATRGAADELADSLEREVAQTGRQATRQRGQALARIEQTRRHIHQQIGINEQQRMPWDLREAVDRSLRALDRIATMRKNPEQAAEAQRLARELIDAVEEAGLTRYQIGPGQHRIVGDASVLGSETINLQLATLRTEADGTLWYWVDPQRQTVSATFRSEEAARHAVADIQRRAPRFSRARTEQARELTNRAAPGNADLDHAVDSLLVSIRQLEEVERLGWTEAAQRSMLRAARQGDIDEIVIDMLDTGWARIGNNLIDQGPEGVVFSQQLARMHTNIAQELKNGGLWRLYDEYTAFFKAFATATPGFHMRNFLSAAFMNMSDGVGVGKMLDALRLFRQFRRNPDEFMNNADKRTRQAFEATFASGAGGRFSPAALDQDLFQPGGIGKVANNPWTRLSNRAGEWVEGPIRLATALDTLRTGGSAADALDRITRLHFDYSQLSNADRWMRRFVPFWTFTSRNLPLQIQQMWMKPRAFAAYNSFVRNMRDEDGYDGMEPLWWRERQAWRPGGATAPWSDNPLYLMPDLQHIGLQEDLEKASNLPRALADVTPLLRVPLETVVADQQFFTGRPFREDENRLRYAISQSIPFIPQAERLFADRSDYAQDRRWQSFLNWLGLPVRELTPGQLAAEQRRQQFDRG